MPFDHILHIAHAFPFYCMCNDKIWFALREGYFIKRLFQFVEVMAIHMPDDPSKAFKFLIDRIGITHVRRWTGYLEFIMINDSAEIIEFIVRCRQSRLPVRTFR